MKGVREVMGVQGGGGKEGLGSGKEIQGRGRETWSQAERFRGFEGGRKVRIEVKGDWNEVSGV